MNWCSQVTIREISGGIIGSSIFIFFIGISGLLKVLLPYISPLTGDCPCRPPGLGCIYSCQPLFCDHHLLPYVEFEL